MNTLSLVHQQLEQFIRPGNFVIDATAGNGRDTVFLCGLVGTEGKVLAFDIQQQAVDNTQKRLSEAGWEQTGSVVLDSHANMAQYAQPGTVDCIVFNLGWLPGGDKSITTLRETTLPAIKTAISLLAPDSVLTVAVYPGHAEGDAEGKMIADYLSELPRWKVCATQIKIINSPTSPYFYVIESK